MFIDFIGFILEAPETEGNQKEHDCVFTDFIGFILEGPETEGNRRFVNQIYKN